MEFGKVVKLKKIANFKTEKMTKFVNLKTKKMGKNREFNLPGEILSKLKSPQMTLKAQVSDSCKFWRRNSLNRFWASVKKGPIRSSSPWNTVVENHQKCRIFIFKFWHFPPICVLLKVTCLVTLFDRKI